MHDWDHVERVLSVNTLQELRSETAGFARRLGFDHHGYAVKFQDGDGPGEAAYHAFHDYRNEWGRSYEALRDPQVAALDARVGLARCGLPAASWNRRGQFAYAPPRPLFRRAHQQVRAAGDFGISAGVTIPCFLRGTDWAFMTFSTDGTQDLRELDPLVGPSVHFVSALQVAVDRLLRRPAPHPKLSRREREVLRWSAIGKTSWEISLILGISERTVNFHVQGACRKLQAQGRRAACARAVALGLISL
ncbi:LuxR family transcriptional regulator [Luteimonas suaedae]|uniref:LuxR family transcriptional regulator n=1 Tax=Luteimonas suaedae TaxID=2605430 RepID=UPI00165958A2|nr:LuxR family transcriptional regulator [Luteimonas suaedae]